MALVLSSSWSICLLLPFELLKVKKCLKNFYSDAPIKTNDSLCSHLITDRKVLFSCLRTLLFTTKIVINKSCGELSVIQGPNLTRDFRSGTRSSQQRPLFLFALTTRSATDCHWWSNAWTLPMLLQQLSLIPTSLQNRLNNHLHIHKQIHVDQY